MTDRFDHEMSELHQRLKYEDDRNVPSFDEVLQRPQGSRKPLWNRRVQVVLVGCVLLVAIGILRQTNFSSVDDHPAVADDTAAVKKIDNLDIDFDRLHAAIGNHFDTIPRLEWSTPTDSLLAMNFNQFTRELNHE